MIVMMRSEQFVCLSDKISMRFHLLGLEFKLIGLISKDIDPDRHRRIAELNPFEIAPGEYR